MPVSSEEVERSSELEDGSRGQLSLKIRLSDAQDEATLRIRAVSRPGEAPLSTAR